MTIFAALLAGLLSAAPAAAQDAANFYKGKTVRIVVGFSPGGGYDIYARAARAPLRTPHSRQSDRRGAEHAGRGEPQVGAISHAPARRPTAR